MVAVDQRAPLRAILEKALGRAPSFHDVGTVKRMLVEELAGEGSAVLIDPEYGLPAALDALPGGPALIVTLEDSNFEVTPGGRKARTIPDWSVEKIKRLGGDGVKFLIWYNHEADPSVVRHQQDVVRRLGEECARYDLAFLVEILVYPQGPNAAAFAERRTELVVRSVEDFADPSFGIDIYKLESPVDPAAKRWDDESRDALVATFERMAGGLPAPWVMLSAAADPAHFAEVLRCAYRAGAGGFLAGRSIWKSAAEAYPDLDEVRRRLQTMAVPYMRSLNAMTDALGTRWRQRPVLPTAAATGAFPAAFQGFAG
jgi:tagatose 1,6-diphosphate aldolase